MKRPPVAIKVRWTPVTPRHHTRVHATVFQKVRVHVHDRAMCFQILRAHDHGHDRCMDMDTGVHLPGPPNSGTHYCR